MTHHKIELTAHHLTRFASTNPLEAVSELIWNGLDADADRVTVSTEFDVLQSMSGIVVADNGGGIPFEQIVERFKRLGDSWKRSSRLSKKQGRFLHGKDGQGRFKALSLGRVVRWSIVYAEGGQNFSYSAQLIADDPTDLIISDAPEKTSRPTGVTVRVAELNPTTRALMNVDALDRIGEKFALYLNQYRDVEINFRGTLIQPETYIVSVEPFTLKPISIGDYTYAVEYDIVEWAVRSERRIYLCDAEGFPLAERNPRFHVPGLDFVGYIRSDYFAALAEQNLIDVDGLDSKVADILEQAKDLTKAYYRQRRIKDTRSVIQKWKEENVYPYEAEALTVAQEAERQVFDLVAVSVKDHIQDFDAQPAAARRFNFELLRQAIERNPTELRSVLEHVLKLPENKLAELAALLEDVTLSNIIEASATVADRLTFVHGLEELVYNEEHSEDLLERAQLHQLVAQNIWLFGEQYNLTVSDKGLSQALKKHAKIMKEKKVIDRPVRRLDGSIGIVDLMLSRAAKPMRSGEIEHLVIELKRPTVDIGMPQLQQAFSYAMAVASDDRFAVGHAEWEFWIVSAGMTTEARALANQAGKPPGLYYDGGTANPKVRVWARTWAEIIHDARVRMQFYKERLNLEIDSEAAVRKLKRTYARYFEEADPQADDEADSAE
ncbi:ATP-binding protein [Sphingomonas sp. CD22]|uniref:ATP-binding protein n=1 Tax=Sphingomonas sp. CD22 TaxID=3100214 RepID=UPI002ADF00B1|nr:ATP-binding protein [Sphingomonas sp. CD22]MEA1084213.1 ATP-binding protein [Sphingomonas sp. CD22]